MLHRVGRHFKCLIVESWTDVFSETSIINCLPKLSNIQEERRSKGESCVIVESTNLSVYGRYRWGFWILWRSEYKKFVLLSFSFSLMKLNFGRTIVDMLKYIFFMACVMSNFIVIHLYIWRLQWFCIELVHLKFIRTGDKFLLKRRSRHWCLSFYNICYQDWRNVGLNLLCLKEFFLLPY